MQNKILNFLCGVWGIFEAAEIKKKPEALETFSSKLDQNFHLKVFQI